MTRPVSCGRGETSLNQTSSPLHEQLDAEQAAPAELVGDGWRDALRARRAPRAHRLRLPGLAVVAVDLEVADRLAEASVPPAWRTVSSVIS